MRRSLEALRILGALGMLVLAGCGTGPTQPGPPPNPQPAELDLSGSWHGTVTDRTGSCGVESFSVELVQGIESGHGFNGPKITGSFATPCQGQFSLQLFLNRNHVVGNVGAMGHVDGVASSSSIDFSIIQGQGGLEGGQTIVATMSMGR